MVLTVRQLAAWVDGEVVGDGEQRIAYARPLTDAEPGDITFVDDDRHLHAWHASPAAAAVVKPTVPVNGRPLIRVRDPMMAFARILQKMQGTVDERPPGDVHPTACIDPSATIGDGANIGPFCVIQSGTVIGPRTVLHAGVSVGRNCRVGADVTLHSHVVLYDNCILGERITIHANSVIGADGYGYRMQNGKHVKVPQLGHVEIGSDVEIGASTTIDRGTFGPTRIGEGTKIDNLVMIAHNCQIGRHNLLVGQVGIAGSSTTGDYVVMGGQVGISDHINVGARAQLGARTVATRDIPPNSRMLGHPATPDIEQLRIITCMEKLPEMRKDVIRIKHHLGLEDA